MEKEYVKANKIAWNEVNSLHQKFKESYKSSFLNNEKFSLIDDKLLKVLEDVCIKDKSILHLCCNDGEELISLKRMGAGKCVGVDISEEAIKSAEDLNDALRLDCQFHAANVYQLDEVIRETFDIVLITVGALAWLSDIELLMQKTAMAMHKGSRLIIQEQHPFSWLIDEEMKLSKTDLYFKKGPYAEEGGLDYLGKTDYKGSVNYTFNYTLSELFNSMIKNSLQLESFFEYPYDISNLKEDLQKEEADYPLSYICVAKKG
jgi:ubiquinone/menaquinone biosynthesis C-methylase UbiE